jgi:hypothetical protein
VFDVVTCGEGAVTVFGVICVFVTDGAVIGAVFSIMVPSGIVCAPSVVFIAESVFCITVPFSITCVVGNGSEGLFPKKKKPPPRTRRTKKTASAGVLIGKSD